MVHSKDYTVRVCRKETISAALPLQEHWLSLSNLDLLLPPLDVGVFFIYAKPPPLEPTKQSFASLVSVLKASLAKALVTYYPFAGEVVSNSMGEPELLCNNRGVEFIEAFGDAAIAELDFYDADRSFEKKLVPEKKEGVLTVQVTEMKCGGMVLGCTFDHRISDAYSFNMFLISWSEIALGDQISTVPSFRRSLLSPRRPGHFEPPLGHLYLPVSQLPPPAKSSDAINRIYYIAATDIDKLQEIASAGGRSSTKLEAFIAYLWKSMAGGGGNQATQMGVVVDGRKRLGFEMDAYFGNVLSIPYASASVGEMEVCEIVEIVHDFVTSAARGEHFKGLVDWVEARRPEAAMARVYVEQGLSVVVSSGRGFPVREAEFGWGKAVFGSYHFPWNGNAGYVMPMPSAKGNGDWVVYAHLSRELVGIVEDDPCRVFKPITVEYLGLE